MSPEGSDAQPGSQPAPQRSHNRLRLAVIDRDPGFMQVLANRLDALGWDYRALPSPITADALVVMHEHFHKIDVTLDLARRES